MQYFEGFNPDSKIWIYQSDRQLTPEESVLIKAQISDFTASWKAHEQPLKADGDVFYNQFIVLVVDEHFEAASGCSIDKSVHLIRKIEAQFNVRLFNRMLIAIKFDDIVRTVSLSEFTAGIADGKFDADTLIFNNTITSLHDLRNNWIVPAVTSWLSVYFPKAAIA